MPIDYSKWDNIDCSSSSSNSEEEEETHKAPRVTRLDTPSRVTRTQNGQLLVEPIQPQQTADKPQPKSPPPPKNNNNNNTSSHWTQNGSICTTPSGSKLYWSQDRYSVTLRLQLPSNKITAKDIQVQCQGILPYTNRSIAVGNQQPASIKVTCQSQILLQGEFPHPVHATEDNIDHPNHCDWELDRVLDNHHTNQSITYWITTLQKATPMHDMVLWWRQPLQQFPSIDPQQANPNHTTPQAQAFHQAWQEAHKLFREKTQQQKQQQKQQADNQVK
jgi:hypothetical protein